MRGAAVIQTGRTISVRILKWLMIMADRLGVGQNMEQFVISTPICAQLAALLIAEVPPILHVYTA